MLIYLLRHGLTEYNAQKRYQGQRDIPLSAEGLSQLRRADIDPKVVYITPLQRTAQTARVLFPEAETVSYGSVEACLNAIASGKAGSMLGTASRLNILLAYPDAAELQSLVLELFYLER